MKTLPCLILACCLSFPLSLWSWGRIGHRTVGEIAQTIMPTQSRARVLEILKGESFADASTWADSLKDLPEWNFSKKYHFEKIPDNVTYLQNLNSMPVSQQKQGGIVMALLEAEKVFLNGVSTDDQKLAALKFIIHFVGDIHQPLHTGRPEDVGGNQIPIKWNDTDTNLHSVWDYFILAQGHADLFSAAPAAAEEKTYAPYLIDKFKNYQAAPESFEDIMLWLNESISYRPDIYTYKDENPTAYTQRFLDTADSRIYLAGIRLAFVLDRLVKLEQPPMSKVNLRTAIEAIVGSISDIIHLAASTTVLQSAYLGF